MATVRAHVVLPAKLADEIDALVGPRGRSAFLVETAEKELKRRRLMAILDSDEPIWREEDHPDIADDIEKAVRGAKAVIEEELLVGPTEPEDE